MSRPNTAALYLASYFVFRGLGFDLAWKTFYSDYKSPWFSSVPSRITRNRAMKRMSAAFCHVISDWWVTVVLSFRITLYKRRTNRHSRSVRGITFNRSVAPISESDVHVGMKFDTSLIHDWKKRRGNRIVTGDGVVQIHWTGSDTCWDISISLLATSYWWSYVTLDVSFSVPAV
jgi:hypothetical protein